MISVDVTVDIIGNILNIPRDVGSHTNTKHQVNNQVFSFLAEVKTTLDSLHLIFRAEQIIKQAKSNVLNVIKKLQIIMITGLI